MALHGPIHRALEPTLAPLGARRHRDVWTLDEALGPARVIVASRRPAGLRGASLPTRELDVMVALRVDEVEEVVERALADTPRAVSGRVTLQRSVAPRPWRVSSARDAGELAPAVERAVVGTGLPWLRSLRTLEAVEREVRAGPSTVDHWMRRLVLAARRGALEEERAAAASMLRAQAPFTRDDFARLVRHLERSS